MGEDTNNQSSSGEIIPFETPKIVSPSPELTPTPIQKAEEILKKIEEANKRNEELIKRNEELIGHKILAGNAQAGSVKPAPKTQEEIIKDEANAFWQRARGTKLYG